MRTHGTLVKWNDERGFGFVAVASGSEEVFVHISAFPRDGQRPQVGDLVSFEIQAGADGKRKALRVQRPGGPPARLESKRPARRESSNVAGRRIGSLLGFAMLVAIGFLAYERWAPVETTTPGPLPAIPLAQPMATGESFTCDGRIHCSQMRSCAEAEYFLAHCPGVRMDGDGDGEPCEEQWCH